MPVGVGMVVSMSATAAVASMLGMMGPRSGMAATMDGVTAITSTSSAGTATSIIALFRSEPAGGPATIATGMAMVGARGCIARLCIPEAPIGGTDTTPARATPTTNGLHTMRLGIVA